jgi:hypothetical protein
VSLLVKNATQRAIMPCKLRDSVRITGHELGITNRANKGEAE